MSTSKFRDRFRLERQIGGQGMTEVWSGSDEFTGQKAVVKVLSARGLNHVNGRTRFAREGEAIMRAQHPNVVQLYQYGLRLDNTPFIGMERAEGQRLDELMRVRGFLAEVEAVHILWQIASALEHMHAKKVLHRDLQPANVIVGERGGRMHEVKVVDFGTAKVLDRDYTEDIAVSFQGVPVKNPWYRSPELLQGEGLDDLRVDIYSVGAIGYELLCRRPPHQGLDPLGILRAHDRPITPPSQINTALKISYTFDRIITRCLKKKPDERFPNAEALRKDLEWLRTELMGALSIDDVFGPFRSWIQPGTKKRITWTNPGHDTDPNGHVPAFAIPTDEKPTLVRRQKWLTLANELRERKVGGMALAIDLETIASLESSLKNVEADMRDRIEIQKTLDERRRSQQLRIARLTSEWSVQSGVPDTDTDSNTIDRKVNRFAEVATFLTLELEKDRRANDDHMALLAWRRAEIQEKLEPHYEDLLLRVTKLRPSLVRVPHLLKKLEALELEARGLRGH